MKRLLSLLFLTTAPTLSASPVAVTETTFHGRDVVSLENGVIRLSVTPEIGGRILEYSLLSNGFNAAQPRIDNLHLEPDDPWPGADYGGITDLATAGWPGAFWSEEYGLEVIPETDGSTRLTATSAAEGIQVHRAMTLFPDSSLLAIRTAQTNLSAHPKASVIRLHCELAVGDRARTGDRVFYPSGGEVKEFSYTIGAEYERFRWMEIDKPWVAIGDPVDRQLLVRTFHSPDYPPPYRLFFWVGYAQSPQQLGYAGAFYALDWFGAERQLDPGESHFAEEEFFLVDGISEADWVSGGIVGAVSLARERSGSSVNTEVDLRIGGATETRGAEVTLLIKGAEGGGPRRLETVRIPPSPPGKASVKTAPLVLEGLEDGHYQLIGEFRGIDGILLGNGSAILRVDQEIRRKAENSVEQTRRVWSRLLEAFPESDHKSDGVYRAEKRILSFRLDEIEDAFASGEYEKAIDRSQEFSALLRRLEKYLGGEEISRIDS